MERLVMSSSSSSRMKDHSNLGGRSNTRSSPPPPLPPPSWSYTSTTTSHHHHQQPDYLSGFTWPPRSYTCSFCKREFRSAQALGGHMNVHRRDRARLRQYSPPQPLPLPLPPRDQCLNLNANPNPNPSSFSSPSSPPSSPSPFPAGRRWASINEGADHLTKVGTRKSLFGSEFAGHRDGSNKLRKKGNVSLELEIGVVSGSSKKDQLDLELRLGI